ncbi:hypothetical protein DFH28DRAFT_1086091 [Melampsora americana]|nr:hypothetical protein DFH28DRAFT_1086091 [Melampsora americana]
MRTTRSRANKASPPPAPSPPAPQSKSNDPNCRTSRPPNRRTARFPNRRTSRSPNRRTSRSSDSESEMDDVYLPNPNTLDSDSNNDASSNTNGPAQTAKSRISGPQNRQKRPRIEEFTSASHNHQDEDVDNSLMNRLEHTLGSDSVPTPHNKNPGNHNSSKVTSRLVADLPTLTNYKDLTDAWPESRISEHQDGLKLGTSVPPSIFEEAKAVQKLYKQHKAVLALVGNISIFTLDKALGELGGTRTPDCLRLWSRYSIKALTTKMPSGGKKGALGEQNRILAKLWNGLSKEEKLVWDPPIFYLLSGLPCPRKPNDNSDDEGSNKIDLLPEEQDRLQVLYDQMVCTSKVSQAYNQVASGTTAGPSLPDYNRRSLQCVQRLHNQIENESNHRDFAYYFLAASTRSATQAGSEGSGWCKEYTSHNDLAKYVREECNFPTVFATHTQGLSVERAVASVIAKRKESSIKPVSSADKVKGELALLLRTRLCFPRGPDPIKLLPEKGYRGKLIQEEGSTLPPKVLKLGFKGMNSKRSLWLNDMKAGLFQFEKVPDVNDQPDQDNQNEPV